MPPLSRQRSTTLVRDALARLEISHAQADLVPFARPGILCLGYTQALRPGVKASLGLALDTVKMADTGATAHKVGGSMVFEA